MSVLKKIIRLNGQSDSIICLQFIPSKGKVTLGGKFGMSEKIWSMYLGIFGECDGEPQFYEVVNGCTRITFNCTFKNYQQALGYISDDEHLIEEVRSFGRLM